MNLKRVKLIHILFIAFIVLNLLYCPAILADKTDLVYKIPITGEIDNGLLKLTERGISAAESAGADLIVFEIDTYGGYVDPAIKIRDNILATNIPTVTYVKGRAWSAGALIALSGQKLVMLSGSSIGAAETRPKEEKYISALRKEFKATAEKRGRNADLAAAMVDSDIAIDNIITKGKLLTLTAAEAADNKLSDLKIDNNDQLYQKLAYSPGKIVTVQMSMAEKAARLITRPTVTTMLISIGIIALIAEVLIAGFGVAGTIGLLALAMVFSSYIYFGVASWGLAVLFLAGLILIGLEIFIVPGFGVTGISGIIAMTASIYLLFPNFETAITALATIVILTIAALIVLIKIFGSSRLGKNISLETSQTREAGYLAQSDKKALLGKKGQAVTLLRPAGIAEVEGERIDVVSEGGFIDRGEEIVISKIAGNRIVVKKSK